MDNLWQSPNCFCYVCRKKNEKNKHFPSTCSPQLCHQSHFLKVTWIQLPMTHYYISLFFFKVIIAYWFSFVSFVKVREGILFLTSPNLCIYVWYQISGWQDFPKHLVCPLMSNITTLQQPLYNLTTHPVILQFHHHFMPFFCSIWALKW